MITTLRFLALALLSSSSTLVFTACHKTEEEPPAPTISEREKFLTSSDWLTNAVTEERITASGVVSTTNLSLPTYFSCNVDDTYHYRADRTYLLDDGLITCPQCLTVSGTWELASNDTELVVKTEAGTSRYPIRRLTATTLSYVIQHDTQPDGTQFSLIQSCAAK
jgi:hypothetical protein